MPHVSGGVAEPAPDDDAAAAEEGLFEEGLAARGEAAPADEEGDLPPGATHETTETDDGERTVHRRRFSAS
jgi:hypothetical protein